MVQKAYNKALHRNWFTCHLFRGATLAKKPPSKPILRARRYGHLHQVQGSFMINRFIVLLLFIVCVDAQADVYKCTSENGIVVLQDNPCKDLGPDFKEKTSEAQNNNDKNIKIWNIKASQGRSYVVGLSSEWEVDIGERSGITSMRAKPTSGSDTTLLLSFLPIKSWGSDNPTAFSNFMQKILKQHINVSKEKVLGSMDLDLVYMKGAVGKLVFLFDEELSQYENIGKGEYLYNWTGAIATDLHLIHATILTNDPKSKNTLNAFTAITTIGIEP
jgi:hypothetical protein